MNETQTDELKRQILLVIDSMPNVTSLTAWLRLDAGYEDAPADPDPLTIDVYDDDGDLELPLYSVPLSELIDRMIDDRSIDGILKDGAENFPAIRNELRRLADRIDEALASRREDAA